MLGFKLKLEYWHYCDVITNCEVARSRVVSVEMAVCELTVKIPTLGFDSLTLIPYRELYSRDLRTFSVDFFN